MPIAGTGKIYYGSSLLFTPGGATATAAEYWLAPPTTDGVNTGASSRALVTVVGSATPFSPGSWVEVDASLSANVSSVVVTLAADVWTSGSNTSTLIQIGTGAGGAEAAWATVAVGYAKGGAEWQVPGYIASGTRVAVRVFSSAVASKSVDLLVSFTSVRNATPTAPVSIGTSSGTAQGVSLTYAGSTNTKGAWTELTSSTSATFHALMVAIQMAGDTTVAAGRIIVDIGTGGSGSETVLIPDLTVELASTEQVTSRSPMTYGVSVASGTRLSARFATSVSGTNAVDLSLVAAGTT